MQEAENEFLQELNMNSRPQRQNQMKQSKTNVSTKGGTFSSNSTIPKEPLPSQRREKQGKSTPSSKGEVPLQTPANKNPCTNFNSNCISLSNHSSSEEKWTILSPAA